MTLIFNHCSLISEGPWLIQRQDYNLTHNFEVLNIWSFILSLCTWCTCDVDACYSASIKKIVRRWSWYKTSKPNGLNIPQLVPTLKGHHLPFSNTLKTKHFTTHVANQLRYHFSFDLYFLHFLIWIKQAIVKSKI